MIKNGKHILVEVKSRVDTSDVLELRRIGELYEKMTRIKPELVIIGGFVSESARRKAGLLGIKVCSYLGKDSEFPLG